jgi:hypothetical protein
MRGSKLTVGLQRGRVGALSEPERFDGYEQRLIRWGCAECSFFEKRVFRSRGTSEELDAYIICRFAGEPIDLIWEATACPKDCSPQLQENKSKSGQGGPHCVPRA